MTVPGLDIARACTRLEEVRADPKDWPSVDLETLLGLWGFQERILRFGQGQGQAVPLRFHPEHPDLYVTLWPSQAVHVEIVLHVVRIIDTLKVRLSIP